jgi:dihydrofolate synthase/folylpolyglutamate synthase
MNSFTSWCQHIEFLCGIERMQPGFERVNAIVASEINWINTHCQIVTVAGTNGKGETIAYLAQALKDLDTSYCLWTSPHVSCLSERIQTEQGKIALDCFSQLAQTIMDRMQLGRVKLSFYEFLYCVFILLVKQVKPQFVLLEVGLGGRLDAVNTLNAQLVLIPSISRDHQEILGPTYRAILQEKLGVMRSQSHLITSFNLNYLIELTYVHALKIGHTYQNLTNKALDFTASNRRLAQAGLEHLLQTEGLDFPIEQTILPSRNQLMKVSMTQDSSINLEFKFFGSHNPDGVRKLIQFLQNDSYTNQSKFGILLSFTRRDKKDLVAMSKMLAKLLPDKANIYLTSFEHFKASDQVEDLAQIIKGSVYVDNYKQYFLHWAKEQGVHRWVVAGSYYFAGDVLNFIKHSGHFISASISDR